MLSFTCLQIGKILKVSKIVKRSNTFQLSCHVTSRPQLYIGLICSIQYSAKVKYFRCCIAQWRQTCFYINKYKLAQASKQRPETNCLFFLKSAHVSLKYKKIELLHCFKKNPAHIDNNKVVVSIKLLVHTHVYFI